MKDKVNKTIKDCKIIKWIIVSVFLISAISLLRLYLFGHYIAEAHLAKALPLSIVVGLTAIAIAIIEKD